MPLLSKKEVINLKLSSIPFPILKEFVYKFNIRTKSLSSFSLLVKELVDKVDPLLIDSFIKEKNVEKIKIQKNIIPDDELKQELMKVKKFFWGVKQGQLDQKIQAEYVRKFVRYEELIQNVKDKLHENITSYVICTWFNHWTTVLIEEHIS